MFDLKENGKKKIKEKSKERKMEKQFFLTI